jgi:hypothetical protein
MKNAVFWDATLCGSCENRCFGGVYSLISRVTRISELATAVALVRTDISDERIVSIIRVKRISELGKTLTVTRN